MISVLTWNIQYGRGRDDRIDLERQAQIIRGHDLVGLQEVERNWRRTGEVDQVARLAELLPEHYHVYAPALDVLKQPSPGPAGAVRRQFGNAVFSRFPILTANPAALPRRALMNLPTSARVALDTIVELPSGRHVRFCSTHLDHAQPALRVEQAEALLRLYRDGPLSGGVEHGARDGDPWWSETIAAPPTPSDMILVGDFNMQPHDEAYARLAGSPDVHFGRRPQLDGFADSWTLAGHPEADGMTWWDDPAKRGKRRLDYVFVSAGLAPMVRTCAILDGDHSDHQPVAVEFDLA